MDEVQNSMGGGTHERQTSLAKSPASNKAEGSALHFIEAEAAQATHLIRCAETYNLMFS